MKPFFNFFVSINYQKRVNENPESATDTFDFQMARGKIGGFHCQSQL